jgi:hypothetical protein
LIRGRGGERGQLLGISCTSDIGYAGVPI